MGFPKYLPDLKEMASRLQETHIFPEKWLIVRWESQDHLEWHQKWMFRQLYPTHVSNFFPSYLLGTDPQV